MLVILAFSVSIRNEEKHLRHFKNIQTCSYDHLSQQKKGGKLVLSLGDAAHRTHDEKRDLTLTGIAELAVRYDLNGSVKLINIIFRTTKALKNIIICSLFRIVTFSLEVSEAVSTFYYY